jgi:uncharacterized protein (DUF1499 family)
MSLNMKSFLQFGLWALVASLFVARIGMYINGLQASPGLVDGKLALCPNKPNCICSEQGSDEAHYIPPIALLNAEVTVAIKALKQAVERSGGKIVRETDTVLTAQYTSRLFGFVDDFQARVDVSEMKIHLRSASRVGRSDFGVNLKRVNKIKNHYLVVSKAQ